MAAIRIADAEGIDAASIRRIAAEIGAGTMSLYRYVPSRDDLVELMVDAVTGELDLPEEPSGDWRADLTSLAHQVRDLTTRHPWLVRLVLGRPVLGPNTLRLIEFGLGALDRRGLPIDETIYLFRLMEGYVRDFVREEIGWAEETGRTGVDREQWTTDNAYVRYLVDSGKYPVFTRMVLDALTPHLDADARFERGLTLVLDGIALVLDGIAPRPAAR